MDLANLRSIFDLHHIDFKGTIPSSTNGKNKNIMQRSPIQLMCRHLRKDKIAKLRIGWCESHYSPKDYERLSKALGENTSVTEVTVGWRLSRNALIKILKRIVHLPNLQVLSLAVHTWLPKWLLKRLVSIPTLVGLELRCVTVGSPRRRPLLRFGTIINNRIHSENYDTNIVRVLPSVSPSVQTLKLIACHLEEPQISNVCRWTQSHPLQELSVACNTNLSPASIDMLCRTARCQRLDLTSCKLGGEYAKAIANAIPFSKSIQELRTPRNHLWEGGECTSPADFDRLAEVCVTHLKHWNIGFCRLTKDQVHSILKLLTLKSSRLESLSMQGIPKSVDGALLEEMLVHNQTLKSLQLYPAGLFCPSHDEVIPHVERGLARNYTLQELQVGHRSPMQDLYLGLNRAGRVHLFHDHDEVDWATVLSRASHQSPSVLYWLIRNVGAGRFL